MEDMERGGYRNRNMSLLFINVLILLVLVFGYCDAQGLPQCPPELSKEDCDLLEQLVTPSSIFHVEGSVVFNGTSIAAAGSDFGDIYHNSPVAVVSPSSYLDIVRVSIIAQASPHLTVAATKGNSHSTEGQAQALHGIVVNMTSLNADVDVHALPGTPYVEVAGGELWVNLLNATLLVGLAPRSWTDYLDLSVGGTLSNAGISGQTYRFGPQISNVLQLEVVTGKGNQIVCNAQNESELFYAVLGGLGQFGVITKARILLQPAPDMARWIRAVYWKLEDFMHDQELLISLPEGQTFDYIEGFVFVNSNDPVNGWPRVPFSNDTAFNASLIPPSAGPVLYCLEVAFNYKRGTNVDQIIEDILSPLLFIRGLQYSKDMTYFDFLNRVHDQEIAGRAAGIWDGVPHPWLNLFVPKSGLVQFDAQVFKQILNKGVGGPILVYPVYRNKWDDRMSAVIPDEDIFYVVSVLWLTKPPPDGPSLAAMQAQNEDILGFCKTAGIPIKRYLSHFDNQSAWQDHFGSRWNQFASRKSTFDPRGILAPGQNMFPRSTV